MCPLQTIQTIVKRGRERDHYEDNPRLGRPPKINDRALRHLNHHVTCNRCQTLQEITNSINLALPAPVAPCTVSRAMHTQLNLSSHVAVKKPFLTAKQRLARRRWAWEHLGWKLEDWERIIWTDEASVEIGKESRQCLVWC